MKIKNHVAHWIFGCATGNVLDFGAGAMTYISVTMKMTCVAAKM